MPGYLIFPPGAKLGTSGGLATVETVNDLRHVSNAVKNANVLLAELGAIYWFDSTSTKVDDGTSSIRPNHIQAGSPGRWLATSASSSSGGASGDAVAPWHVAGPEDAKLISVDENGNIQIGETTSTGGVIATDDFYDESQIDAMVPLAGNVTETGNLTWEELIVPNFITGTVKRSVAGGVYGVDDFDDPITASNLIAQVTHADANVELVVADISASLVFSGGPALRMQDSGSGYLVNLADSGGGNGWYVQLLGLDFSQDPALADNYPFINGGPAPYYVSTPVLGTTVKISSVGNVITVSYNGEEIITFQDSTWASGKVGFIANGGPWDSFKFDNEIVTIDGKLGIGKVPTARLDVAGDAKVDGNITAKNFSGESSGTNTGDQTNAELLNTYTQTEDNLADTVAKKHNHTNKALLDTYTQTEVDIADAIAKEHVHANKAALDNVSGTNTGDQDLTQIQTDIVTAQNAADAAQTTAADAVVGGNGVDAIWSGTQAQYDALGSYDATTMYVIEDA